MTKSVNVHEAKTHLSRLLDEVEDGVDIVIARAGVACARLTSVAAEPRRRGLMATVWPDLVDGDPFFEPLPDDELAAWG